VNIFPYHGKPFFDSPFVPGAVVIIVSKKNSGYTDGDDAIAEGKIIG
jgi:hypothetical protein